ncbi:MAG TPA: hypothetical protein VE995_01015 [Gaiellaceae bacterium]|nr:hypothetical protein [Gaiellaceae bacterium]
MSERGRSLAGEAASAALPPDVWDPDSAEEDVRQLAARYERVRPVFQPRRVTVVVGTTLCLLDDWEGRLLLNELRLLPPRSYPRVGRMVAAFEKALGSTRLPVEGDPRLLLRAVEGIRRRRELTLPPGLRALHAALLGLAAATTA